MRPACDEGHAIEANDQKVALVVFISLPLQPIRELMQHLLPSNWLKVTQLCFVNTVLHRAFLVGFCFYPSRCILLSCCVRSVTYNEFKDRKVLFVEICFMYLWCFLFFEALTKTPPVLWEMRELLCLATVCPLWKCSRGLDARLLLSVLSSSLLSRLLIFFVWV